MSVEESINKVEEEMKKISFADFMQQKETILSKIKKLQSAINLLKKLDEDIVSAWIHAEGCELSPERIEEIKEHTHEYYRNFIFK